MPPTPSWGLLFHSLGFLIMTVNSAELVPSTLLPVGIQSGAPHPGKDPVGHVSSAPRGPGLPVPGEGTVVSPFPRQTRPLTPARS